MGRTREQDLFPATPSQFFGEPVRVMRGEPTGQVYCPRKMATIAVMRCGEFQQRDGCALGCKNAATTEQLAEVAAVRRHAETEGVHKGSGVGPKRGLDGRSELPHSYGMCRRCKTQEAIYKSERLCASCYRYVMQPPLCAACGQQKKSITGKFCVSCGKRKTAREQRIGIK